MDESVSVFDQKSPVLVMLVSSWRQRVHEVGAMQSLKNLLPSVADAEPFAGREELGHTLKVCAQNVVADPFE
jgi:hypothetical protein